MSEFKAVSDALSLQWEVSKNLYNDFCCTPICRNFPFPFPWAPSHRPHSGPNKGLQVKFDDQIDVWIGTDGNLEICHIRLSGKSIQDWDEKLWSRKNATNSSGSEFRAPLSEMAVLSRSSHDGKNEFLFQTESPIVPEVEQLCPRDGILCQVDETCMVQTSQLKHSTHSDQDVVRLAAFNEGQASPTDQELRDGTSDDAGNSDSNPESMSASSGVRPPSSTQGRQEVIMFHLMDPPIRALLDWSDYDRMIAEIAFHFCTTPINVVDAYEINTELSGLPPRAIPIIVHLLPDIAIGHTAGLALFDLEFHAHPTESSFRLGPTVQRFVHVTPEWCDRDAVLLMADVELYCACENDRCFVWYDGVRWPDTDAEQKKISHGDHIRIALPPTDRSVCSTLQMVRWTQSGYNGEEILHFTTEHEAVAGYSPSLLEQD